MTQQKIGEVSDIEKIRYFNINQVEKIRYYKYGTYNKIEKTIHTMKKYIMRKILQRYYVRESKKDA